MTSYFLAPALVRLRAQVNARFPERDKSSDGWIGDASHAARPSDHNPDWAEKGNRRGIVRAVDLDIDDNDPRQDLAALVLAATIGDSRVWYVIHKGRIWSRTYGWTPRKYAGNPHNGHIHVSLRHTAEAEFSADSWLAPAGPTTPRVAPRPSVRDAVDKVHAIITTLAKIAPGGYRDQLLRELERHYATLRPAEVEQYHALRAEYAAEERLAVREGQAKYVRHWQAIRGRLDRLYAAGLVRS